MFGCWYLGTLRSRFEPCHGHTSFRAESQPSGEMRNGDTANKSRSIERETSREWTSWWYRFESGRILACSCVVILDNVSQCYINQMDLKAKFLWHALKYATWNTCGWCSAAHRNAIIKLVLVSSIRDSFGQQQGYIVSNLVDALVRLRIPFLTASLIAVSIVPISSVAGL